MRGSGADLVTDELGDVDAVFTPAVDLIPRRERSGQERLGCAASLPGARTGPVAENVRVVTSSTADHMGVAGTAGGDALLSDELPRA